MFWFKADVWDGGGGGIISSRSWSGYEDGDLIIGNREKSLTDLSVVVWGNGAWQEVRTPISIDQWYHVAYTWNLTTGKKLYLNGILKDTNNNTDPVFHGIPINFGRQGHYQGYRYFYGIIDEAKIYNRALTAEEIGLVAYYSFDDGTATDNSGNGNNGTIYGATWVDGISGKALRFDGVDDYVSTADIDLAGDFTFELWIKRNKVSGQYLISKHGGGYTGYSLALDTLQSNSIRGFYGNGYSWQDVEATGISWKTNVWYHIVFTKAGTNLKIFLDGTEAGSAIGSGSTVLNNNNLTTGSAFSLEGWFNGTIDEVHIYNRALSADEIKAHYDEAKPSEEPGTYPSICGIHNGTITMTHTINVSKICIYPCTGTGGHIEYAKIWNVSWEGVEAHWYGYVGDWHSCSFDKNFTLVAGEMYNYTIRTGSYPQIIHESAWNAIGGVITCTEFVDMNGKRYEGWIPAIRLE